ncbi:hypothetical protein JMJ35_005775 [Cladonia borealis]|uniref:Uncharacterized protein n=1 Tax=Cladonia borealis TaxID=184061 RepID=A0AA39R194_9LECA|nr:hypothetical protein JMJ35_005775 [Cladonia borealis]
MYTTPLVVIALCALTSLANPTPDLEKRYTKTRITQFGDSQCSTGKLFETKGWTIDHNSCVDIDGQTNGFTMSLGTGPLGHNSVHAFSETGCGADTDMGEIPAINGEEPDTGSCVDANNYMMAEPNYYGHRINSIKFLK